LTREIEFNKTMMADNFLSFEFTKSSQMYTPVRRILYPTGFGKIFKKHGNGGITHTQLLMYCRSRHLLPAFLHGIDNFQTVTDTGGKFLNWFMHHLLLPKKYFLAC